MYTIYVYILFILTKIINALSLSLFRTLIKHRAGFTYSFNQDFIKKCLGLPQNELSVISRHWTPQMTNPSLCHWFIDSYFNTLEKNKIYLNIYLKFIVVLQTPENKGYLIIRLFPFCCKWNNLMIIIIFCCCFKSCISKLFVILEATSLINQRFLSP